jgi:hypothetical protein
MRSASLMALTLLVFTSSADAQGSSQSPGDRATQSGCAQGSTTGACSQYRLRAPPPPPERPLTVPRSSEQIVPPMERVPPPAPLVPRVGN